MRLMPRKDAASFSVVMPGFRPGIYEFAGPELVDARAKPGHDDRVETCRQRLAS